MAYRDNVWQETSVIPLGMSLCSMALWKGFDLATRNAVLPRVMELMAITFGGTNVLQRHFSWFHEGYCALDMSKACFPVSAARRPPIKVF